METIRAASERDWHYTPAVRDKLAELSAACNDAYQEWTLANPSEALESWNFWDKEVTCELIQDPDNDELEELVVSTPNGSMGYPGLMISEPYGTPEHSYVGIALMRAPGDLVSLGVAEFSNPDDRFEDAVAKVVIATYDDAIMPNLSGPALKP